MAGEPQTGIAPGARVDAYEVLEPLPEALGCEVFRVEHSLTSAHYRLKALRSDASDTQAERFLREGRLMAGLERHPHVAHVIAAGEFEGRPYLVMPEYPGGDLATRLQRGPLPVAEALDLVAKLSRGLAHVHAAGVLHRGLSPSSVVFDDDDEGHLTDFGTARQGEAGGEGGLTTAGTLLGPLGFAAPEQLQSVLRADARSDVYSLGALLYACVVGAEPYPDCAFGSLQASRQGGPVPRLREVEPETPRALDELCARAMAFRPEDRPASASALADALEEVRSPAPWLLRRGPLLFCFAAAFAALGLAWAALANRGIAPVSSPTQSASPEESAPRELPSGSPAPPSASPEDVGERLLPGKRPGEWINERDGSVLIRVEGGSLLMGASEAEGLHLPDRFKDGLHDAHRVEVAPYYIAKHEVTWGQYRRYLRETGREERYYFGPPGAGEDAYRRRCQRMGLPPRVVRYQAKGHPDLTPGDEHPAAWLTWSEARGYCAWAGLRLPSEAEWEFAARGPEGLLFPWGNEYPFPGKFFARGVKGGEARPVANLGDYTLRLGSVYADGHRFPAPVGSLPLGVSPLGCLDMAGNVAEWVEDPYQPYDAPPPPPGPAFRVHRGGSFKSGMPTARGYARESFLRQDRTPERTFGDGVGVRPARSLD